MTRVMAQHKGKEAHARAIYTAFTEGFVGTVELKSFYIMGKDV